MSLIDNDKNLLESIIDKIYEIFLYVVNILDHFAIFENTQNFGIFIPYFLCVTSSDKISYFIYEIEVIGHIV